MRHDLMLHLTMLAFTLAMPPMVLANSFTVETIEFPGAYGTMACGINNRGQIVGYYYDTSGGHGFLLDRGGFTKVDFPKSDSTIAYDINDRGQIVGNYYDNSGGHGFLLDKGKSTTIDFPEADWTVACGINNRGQIVGYYYDSSGRHHGFFFDRGRFTAINFPEADWTMACGINNRGQIVGSYCSPYGFFLDKGEFTRIDIDLLEAYDINDHGQIAGTGPGGGGLLDKGEFTKIDIDLLEDYTLRATGINNRCQIVGYYETDFFYGFIAEETHMAPPSLSSRCKMTITWARIKAE